MTQSLYERIGGNMAVTATVLKLYEKILKDEMLAPFFENVDVAALRRSQTAFVTVAFGGTDSYHGRGMRDVHKNACENGLSDIHFDRVAHHLAASMRELGVTDDLINESLTIVETTRNDVLNRPAA